MLRKYKLCFRRTYLICYKYMWSISENYIEQNVLVAFKLCLGFMPEKRSSHKITLILFVICCNQYLYSNIFSKQNNNFKSFDAFENAIKCTILRRLGNNRTALTTFHMRPNQSACQLLYYWFIVACSAVSWNIFANNFFMKFFLFF